MERSEQSRKKAPERGPAAAARATSPHASRSMARDLRPEAAGDRALVQAMRAGPETTSRQAEIAGLFGPAAQMRAASAREDGEALLQGLFASPAQLACACREPAQRMAAAPAAERGGLPGGLKAGVEALAGVSMAGVQVHYGSNRPAELGALAFAQGADIHLGPGQDHHLPHEAWHVAQQRQGRVRPTLQAKGVPINDDPALEREADVMGTRAASESAKLAPSYQRAMGQNDGTRPVAQRMITVKLDAKSDKLKVTTDAKRPPGQHQGHQDDHTTAFAVLQDQIANGIKDQTVGDALASLKATYAVYKTLPGWGKSRKGHIARYTAAIDAAFAESASTQLVQKLADLLLGLRNGLEYTSIKKGGHGNGEGKWRGGLDHIEKQLRSDKKVNASKDDIEINMQHLLDIARVSKKKNADQADDIVDQHAITVVDAYPVTSEHFGITPKDVTDRVKDAMES